MRDKKLISMRLDDDVIQYVEAFCKNHRYWKKTTVLNALLSAVVNNFPEKDVYDMARWNLYSQNEVACHFEITQYMKKPKTTEDGENRQPHVATD